MELIKNRLQHNKIPWLPAQLEETEKAWLAGFFDGEGTIGLLKNKRTEPKRLGQIEYHSYIVLVNTNKETMDYIQRMIGGNSIKVRRPKNKKHKLLYVKILSSLQADQFIQLIYPYLITKKRHADYFLQYRKTIHKNYYCKGGISEEDKIIRKEIIRKLKNLNNRGGNQR